MKTLCAAHVSLLEADIILTMLLEQIEKLSEHPFSNKMYEALIFRINQRRNTNSIVLGFLEHQRVNPNVHKTMVQLSSLSDAKLIDILVKLYKRSNPVVENSDVTETVVINEDEEDIEVDFAIRLKKKISKLYTPNKKPVDMQ